MALKVSFITGVKDNARELKEMIGSLIDQDMSEWEAIIVDDNSQEPLREIVSFFQDSRLKYFRQSEEKSGVAEARNLAVKNANSEICIVADGDDTNRPQRARKIYNIMAAGNCDAFYSNVEYFNPEKNIRRLGILQPFNERYFRMYNFIIGAGAAFRKDKFLEIGGYDPTFKMSEDYDLFLRILNSGGKFCYTPEILVNYRRSSKSITIEKRNQLHDFIQKTRVKNHIPPFDIETIRQYITPGLVDEIMAKNNLELWNDDRFKK